MEDRLTSVRFAGGLVLLLAAAACGDGLSSPASTPGGRLAGDLNVFAAASLTGPFTAMAADFKARHPRVNLTFNFAGTPTLLTQMQQGASADVFASADDANMQKAIAAGLVAGSPEVFARNKLQIVVQEGNPKHVTGLGDLARSDLVYVSAAPGVPAGTYALQALAKAGVKANPRSLETDVKSVVSKVSLGEADAGIVYVTDVRAAGGRVTGVDIPDGQNVVATYPVAEVKEARNTAGSRSFIEYLLSSSGQGKLAGFGFIRV